MTRIIAVRISVLATPLLLLMACNSSNFELGGANERVGPPVPFGTQRAVGVDGMTVGDRLMEAGEFEVALESYRRAAAETGVTAENMSAMGSANLRLGRLNQAKTLLDRAIELDQGSASAWNNLGVVLMNFHEAREAREAFRIAFGIDSGDSELIRQNLILANEVIGEQSAEIAVLDDFRLVRHGNGSYLLLGN